MTATSLLARSTVIAVVGLLFSLGLAAVAVAQPQVPCGYCVEGECIPNTMNFGFYPTKWRRWPTEKRKVEEKKELRRRALEDIPPGDLPNRFEEEQSSPPGREWPPTLPDEFKDAHPDFPPSGGEGQPVDPFQDDLTEPGSSVNSTLDEEKKKEEAAPREGSSVDSTLDGKGTPRRNAHSDAVAAHDTGQVARQTNYERPVACLPPGDSRENAPEHLPTHPGHRIDAVAAAQGANPLRADPSDKIADGNAQPTSGPRDTRSDTVEDGRPTRAHINPLRSYRPWR